MLPNTFGVVPPAPRLWPSRIEPASVARLTSLQLVELLPKHVVTVSTFRSGRPPVSTTT